LGKLKKIAFWFSHQHTLHILILFVLGKFALNIVTAQKLVQFRKMVGQVLMALGHIFGSQNAFYNIV
jgi:uncharacterized membrane protein (UPF0136 family)